MEDTNVIPATKKKADTKAVSKKSLISAPKPDVELPVGVEDQIVIKKQAYATSENNLAKLKRGREIRAAKIEEKKALEARIEPMKPKEVAPPFQVAEVIKKRKPYAKDTIKSELAEMKALLKEKAVPVPVAEPVPVIKEVIKEVPVPVVKEVIKERVVSGSALLDKMFFNR